MAEDKTTTLLPEDHDGEPRPGASLRAAARQYRTVLIVIAVAIAVLIAFAIWTAVSSSPQPHHGPPGKAGSAGLPSAAGPRRIADGVPVGYADTRAGAVAAAVNYQLARSKPTYVTDTAARRAVLRQIMAASALQAQINNDDASAAAAMTALGLTSGGQGPGGATWMEHSAPLGVQVTSYSSRMATINVWMAEIAGVIGDPNTVLPPSGSYSTYLLTLVWESSDWRIASIATESGPVPSASTNQSPSSQQEWQQSGSFDPPPPVP